MCRRGKWEPYLNPQSPPTANENGLEGSAICYLLPVRRVSRHTEYMVTFCTVLKKNREPESERGRVCLYGTQKILHLKIQCNRQFMLGMGVVSSTLNDR
jgi:hypothetical protein